MSNQAHNDRNTRLAMATAALGMCMGITPVTSLAMPTSMPSVDRSNFNITIVPSSQKLAAGYLKLGDIKGEAKSLAGQTARDAASGAATGKRQHKPISVVKPATQPKPRAGYIKIGDIKGE